VGGPGDDHLVGGATENDLAGGPGDDRLDGGGGPDTLLGDPGRDVMRGGDGDDLLDNVHDDQGRSDLHRGRDRLVGGRGYDDILGTRGNVLVARDPGHGPDRVRCIHGGVAEVDIADLVLGPCQAVHRDGPARAVPVGDARFLSDIPSYVVLAGRAHPAVPHGDMATGVACPVDRHTRCRGVLRIADGGGVIGHTAFAPVKPGHGRQLNVHVGAAALRRAEQGDRAVTVRVATRRHGPDLRVSASLPVR
jgi:RTX calcium-binding nonapeptide repeat (4 copies)